jgi:hypothetical protein
MRTIALIKRPTDDGNMPNLYLYQLIAAVSVAAILLAVLMVRLKESL